MSCCPAVQDNRAPEKIVADAASSHSWTTWVVPRVADLSSIHGIEPPFRTSGSETKVSRVNGLVGLLGRQRTEVTREETALEGIVPRTTFVTIEASFDRAPGHQKSQQLSLAKAGLFCFWRSTVGAQVFEPSGPAGGIEGLPYPSAVRPGGRGRTRRTFADC